MYLLCFYIFNKDINFFPFFSLSYLCSIQIAIVLLCMYFTPCIYAFTVVLILMWYFTEIRFIIKILKIPIVHKPIGFFFPFLKKKLYNEFGSWLFLHVKSNQTNDNIRYVIDFIFIFLESADRLVSNQTLIIFYLFVYILSVIIVNIWSFFNISK